MLHPAGLVLPAGGQHGPKVQGVGVGMLRRAPPPPAHPSWHPPPTAQAWAQQPRTATATPPLPPSACALPPPAPTPTPTPALCLQEGTTLVQSSLVAMVVRSAGTGSPDGLAPKPEASSLEGDDDLDLCPGLTDDDEEQHHQHHQPQQHYQPQQPL